MAQILKDDQRNKIIEAAKEEFLEKGFKDASLRNIAKKANMTVGNLYRYFTNKEDINKQIVKVTLDLLEDMVTKLSNNKLSFEGNAINFDMSNDELIESLDKLTDEMVDIYMNHKIEFNILMMQSKLNDEITNWFSNVCKGIALKNYNLSDDIDGLAHAYAVSIFSGLKDLFKNENNNYAQLKKHIKIYFRTYVHMLNNDIQKYLGENL